MYQSGSCKGSAGGASITAKSEEKRTARLPLKKNTAKETAFVLRIRKVANAAVF